MIFGEIGLSGEVRVVNQGEARLKEAAKLGFARALLPKHLGKRDRSVAAGFTLTEVGHLQDLVALFADRGVDRPEEWAGTRSTP